MNTIKINDLSCLSDNEKRRLAYNKCMIASAKNNKLPDICKALK